MSTREWHVDELQLPCSSSLSLSSDLHRLVATSDLQQMMQHIGSSTGTFLEQSGQRSRSNRGTPGILAQWGLSQSEVDRWMRENAADPRSDRLQSSTSSRSSEMTQKGVSAEPAAPRRSAPQIWPLAAAEQVELAAPILPPAGRSVLQPADLSGVEHLQHFESRVRQVAQQVAALRIESQRLRGDVRVDQRRLDAAERLLALTGSSSLLGRADSGGSQRTTGDPPQTSSMSPVRKSRHVSREVMAPTLARLDVLGASSAAAAAVPAAYASTPQDQKQCRAPKAIRRRNHRQDQLSALRRWFYEHASDPYPTPEEKMVLASEVGMEVKQIEHWFTNHRKRHWAKEQAGAPSTAKDDGRLVLLTASAQEREAQVLAKVVPMASC